MRRLTTTALLSRRARRRSRTGDVLVRDLARSALAGASMVELASEALPMFQEVLRADVIGYLECTSGQHVKAAVGAGWTADFAHDGRLLPIVPGGPTEAVLAAARPLVITERTLERASPATLEAGVRSSLLAPVGITEQVGVLGVHRTSGRAFAPADVLLMAAVADVLTLAARRLANERALWNIATHDPLTGLANRRLFEAKLVEALTAGSVGAVVVLDLDGFKGLNDREGHAAGDEALVLVAQALRAVVRTGDTVARLGGDEFAVILPGVSSGVAAYASAQRLAAAARTASRDRFPLLDASAGAARWPTDGVDVVTLVSKADAVMLARKAHGAYCPDD